MHYGNQMFWQYCAEKYRKYFHAKRVLEVGSYNVNGTVRDYFECLHYVGVDWRPGPGVDVVCMAKDMQFETPFDVVISASMLEHDPTWKESIERMLDCLRSDGILLLSWGGAHNDPHELETAVDGRFHALPAGKVIGLLCELGVYIHEFRYEGNTPWIKRIFVAGGQPSMGHVCLVAFKDHRCAVGERIIDDLLPEDCFDYVPPPRSHGHDPDVEVIRAPGHEYLDE